MADTIFRTIVPDLKAVDNGDGTFSLAVQIVGMPPLTGLTAGELLVASSATAATWTNTIDQLLADTAIIKLASTGDVVTVLTTAPVVDVATADYMAMAKWAAATGGLIVQAMGENAAVTTNLGLYSYGGQASTTKSTAGRSLIEAYASQHDGANALANITADGNVFGIRARVGA
ncbi:hypothetical protein LCGC14_2292660, partial [marine sediment metagenome]